MPDSASANASRRDIVIVGGGIIGCTTAYYLSRHPAYNPSRDTITLLEATKIAGGASGKAGGLLALWAYPSSLVPLSYRLHKELADEHGGVDRWGYRAVHCGQVECIGQREKKEESQEDWSNRRNVNGNNNTNGDSAVSLQKRSKDALARLRAAGVPADLDWIREDSLRTYDAMGDPSTTAQVHPYQFTTAIAELAKEKGVNIKVNASVTGIEYSGDDKSAVEAVTFEQGNTQHTLPATDIVVAAGPWTRSVLPSAPIAALRAHSVTIRPSQPVSAYALFTQIQLPPTTKGNRRSGTEVVAPEIYARPNNEVYACGEGDRLVPLPPTTSGVEVDQARCDAIVDAVGSISDELRDGTVTARQACYLPNVSVGNGSSPLVGPTGVKGLWLAAGHTCWGIQNGPATGKLMSEFVFDGEAKSAKVSGLDPRKVL